MRKSGEEVVSSYVFVVESKDEDEIRETRVGRRKMSKMCANFGDKLRQETRKTRITGLIQMNLWLERVKQMDWNDSDYSRN